MRVLQSTPCEYCGVPHASTVEYLLQHLQLVVAHARDVVHLRLERLDRGSLPSAQARCAAQAGGRSCALLAAVPSRRPMDPKPCTSARARPVTAASECDRQRCVAAPLRPRPKAKRNQSLRRSIESAPNRIARKVVIGTRADSADSARFGRRAPPFPPPPRKPPRLTAGPPHPNAAPRCCQRCNDVMRCDAVRCGAMRCDAVRCSAMRCDLPASRRP